MEDFNKKLDELKRQVIFEIEQILPEGKSHQYTDTFHCTMIDGDGAVSTIADIIKNENGLIKLVTVSDTMPETYDDLLSTYEIETIIYAYEQLRKELRAHKIERIRQLVEQAGGKIECNSAFSFRHYLDGAWVESTVIKTIEVGNVDHPDGEHTDCIWFDCLCEPNGETHEETDSDFADDELDSILSMVEQATGNLDISLTDEQKDAVEQFETALAKLKAIGVAIIKDAYSTDIYFVNGNGFKFDSDWGGIPAGFVSVQEQVENAPCVTLVSYSYNSDNGEDMIAKRI